MSKQDDALDIIRALGLPSRQQNERSVLTLLALAGIGPRGSWRKTSQSMLRIWDIMAFMRDRYDKDYAANSRETIRRHTIHQFEQARMVDRNPDDPTRPTNSGQTCYALTDDVVVVLKAYGTKQFDRRVAEFIERFGELQTAYNKLRDLHKVSLQVQGGEKYRLSPGNHNQLQAAIINDLGPRFAPGATILYIGDTAKKYVMCETKRFEALNVAISEHDKLPDIVLYDAKKRWLYLIEAVTSHGPVSPKRHAEIESMMCKCPAERIYVTAFPNRTLFRQYAAEIAWETEVWIADNSDHMIHFDGEKFLGPYQVE